MLFHLLPYLLVLSSWMNIWLETKGELINYSSCRALVLLWKALTFELSRRHLQIYMPSIVWGSQPCIKGCKRPCQFSEDNSTKTPFFSVVMGIMLFTGVLPKPVGNLTLWCYWLHWWKTSNMETFKLSVGKHHKWTWPPDATKMSL